MKAPDARQSSLIHECGCDPDRYLVVSEKNGWIHAIDKDNSILAHFDLERKMVCYSEDIMNYVNAKPGNIFILTERGVLSIPERKRGGAVAGEPIRGRETSVLKKWVLMRYVIESEDNR